MNRYVKVIVYSPLEAADKIRSSLAEIGCGKLGNYDSWSIATEVVERFRPLEGANPTTGKCMKVEKVITERVEVQCLESNWKEVVEKIKTVHPYETPAIEVIPLLYPSPE